MKREPKYARCEHCKRKVLTEYAERNWSQTGKSQWGKRYCPDGLAWECRKCELNLKGAR